MNQNVEFWGYGSNADVKLSYEDYWELCDCLHDERLSRDGLMKFRNLHETNVYGMAFMPFFCFPFGWAAALLATGKARRSHSGYRYVWMTMSLTWPAACWYGFTTALPRRLYTEIVCDEGTDGTYVRQRLLHKKPGLWRALSQQLTKKGYRFPEQIETASYNQFPLDFVNKRLEE